MSKHRLVLLSGGIGSRMQLTRPKQFLLLNKKPVLVHSLESFWNYGFAKPFIIVAHPDHIEETQAIVSTFGQQYLKDFQDADIKIISGGATRHESSLNAFHEVLKIASNEDIIFVHDAARPIVKHAELDRLISLFENPKCQIGSLASKVTDTLVEYNPEDWQTINKLNREKIMSIKTPQAIRINTVKYLIKRHPENDFTDLLGFGSAAKINGFLAEAEPTNIKLTNPTDIKLLEYLLKSHGFSQ